MSNKPSLELFDLIKSLSKTEKRYFKIYASKHVIGEENNYTILFNYLDSLLTYDEDTLLIHFNKEAFIKKFSITKKRLYDYIITAIEQYRSTNDSEIQLNRLIHSVDFLIEKTLFEQAEKQLKRAEKLAKKLENFPLLLHINNKRKKLQEAVPFMKKEELIYMSNNDAKFVKQQQSYQELWQIKAHIFHVLNSENNANEKLEEYHKKLKHYENAVLNEECDYILKQSFAAIYFYKQDYLNCLHYLDIIITTINLEKKENIGRYLSALSNAIYICLQLNKEKEASTYFKLFEHLKNNEYILSNEHFQTKYFTTYYSALLTHYNNPQQIDKLKPHISVIESGLLLYSNQLLNNRKLFFYYELAYYFYLLADYHQALKQINTALSCGEEEVKDQLYSSILLLNVLIHYELNNTSLLPYATQSLKRYFKNKSNKDEYLLFFVNALKLSASKTSVQEKKLFWEEIEIKMKYLQESSFNQINIKAWVSAKIFGKSYRDYLEYISSKASLKL